MVIARLWNDLLWGETAHFPIFADFIRISQQRDEIRSLALRLWEGVLKF